MVGRAVVVGVGRLRGHRAEVAHLHALGHMPLDGAYDDAGGAAYGLIALTPRPLDIDLVAHGGHPAEAGQDQTAERVVVVVLGQADAGEVLDLVQAQARRQRACLLYTSPSPRD